MKPNADLNEPCKPDPLAWGDNFTVPDWLRALERHAHDAIATGFGATAPPLRRVLTRGEVCKRVREARPALGGLFFAARRPV